MQGGWTRRTRRGLAAVAAVGLGTTVGGCAAPPYNWSFELLSVDAAGTDSGNDRSGEGALGSPPFVVSADGSTIAFHSFATDLAPGDTGAHGDDIYVRDLDTGGTTLATVTVAGTAANFDVGQYALSADGTKLAFASGGDQFVAGDANGSADVFVRDLVAGTTTLVTANAAGTGSANRGTTELALSPDGTEVAFTSTASNLVTPNRGDTTRSDVYLRDLAAGQTTLVSIDGSGLDGVQPSYQPVFSPQGDAVAFTSADPLGVSADDGRTDVFLRRLASATTTLVSTAAPAPAPASTQFFEASTPVFRPDGGAIVYLSDAYYRIGSEISFYTDLDIADLATGTVELVSVHPVPTAFEVDVEKLATDARFSPDGTKVLFSSSDGYYDPVDTNQGTDLYLRDLVSDTTSLVTVNADATNGIGRSFHGSFSPDGASVVFTAPGDAVAPPGNHNVAHVYLRELAAKRTSRVGVGDTVPGAIWTFGSPVFLAGGTRIAFVTQSGAVGPTDTNGDLDVYLATGTRPAPAGGGG